MGHDDESDGTVLVVGWLMVPSNSSILYPEQEVLVAPMSDPAS